MSIDVLIKQKLFGGKTMPLDVILGERLQYGNFENEQLTVGELGEHEFIAYNPEKIGRGFSVVWNPNEKKQIVLRLLQPSTTQEMTDFYAAIQRMATHWSAKLVVDGNKMSLDTFMAGFQDALDFNAKTLKQISQDILNGEHDSLTLYSAMFPLSIGKEEAALFLNDPESYARWLHEKQSADVYFSSPRFFIDDDNNVVGRYFLLNDTPTVMPNHPTVPFGVRDLNTGKPVECEQWTVLIGLQTDENPLCQLEYSEFLNRVPNDKKSKFDADHFLLGELTEQEIRALAQAEAGGSDT